MLDPKQPVRWARLGEAASLAFRIHAEQLRKGTTTPYVSHLLGVASIVLEHGGETRTKAVPPCCMTPLRTAGPNGKR